MGAIEVSRAGFPVRTNHKECVLDYNCLSPTTDVNIMMKDLDKKFELSKESDQGWAVGKNMVFFKQNCHDFLQDERMKVRNKMATRIQSRFRGIAARENMKQK